jgi:hypothetical protein
MLDATSRFMNGRVFSGFTIAPVPAAAIFATFLAGERMSVNAYLGWVGVTLVVAWLWTAILGVPVYLLLRRIAALNLLTSVLAGALIAAVPTAVLRLDSPGGSWIAGGKILVQQGKYTAGGYALVAQSVAIMAMLGLISGILFWVIALRKMN